MSSPERKTRPGLLRGLVLSACIAAMAAGSACTVRPLYSDVATSTAMGTTSTAAYPSINIKPVETRYAQEVRNQLIFLLNGGAGQPANAQYSLDLGVTVLDTRLLRANTASNEDRPTAGSVAMTSSYVLRRADTGEIVSTGTRRISSSYDRPRQEFAALRAERDAENRAARELAELLKLAIGQDLSKLR
jgi:LPS-assembly lipoprotein